MINAFHAAGTKDTTRVDLVDFPPLVHRTDPHYLLFSDDALDLALSDDPSATSDALFPSCLAREAERAIRHGGDIALVLDQEIEAAVVATLFKRSCHGCERCHIGWLLG